jgi:hypothetical protein
MSKCMTGHFVFGEIETVGEKRLVACFHASSPVSWLGRHSEQKLSEHKLKTATA